MFWMEPHSNLTPGGMHAHLILPGNSGEAGLQYLFTSILHPDTGEYKDTAMSSILHRILTI